MTSGAPLTVDFDASVAVITLSRPERRNALSRHAWQSLREAIRNLSGSDHVRGLILTGSGERAFAAGADLTELVERPAMAALEPGLSAVLDELEDLSFPTVAALNGHALGGGWELALACDLRVAATHVRVGFPEVSLGIMPGAGGTRRILQQVGLGRAKELILTGRLLTAEEAYGWGLVNHVAGPSGVMSAARALLSEVADGPALALRLAKLTLNATARGDCSVDLERLAYTLTYHAADRTERMTEFLAHGTASTDGLRPSGNPGRE